MEMPFYHTDDKKFYNPLALFSYAAVHTPNMYPKFNFMDDEFDKVNWAIEPTESFDALCERRAIQLRLKYDRLVFFFSGGTDSITIYNVFKRSKIHIDEIIIYYHNDVNVGHPMDNVKWIRDNHYDPTTIITAYDRNEIQDYYLDLKDDWTIDSSFTPQPSPMRNTMEILHGRRAETFSNESWAAIIGLEKPHIILKDGKWYATHLDKLYGHFLTSTPDLNIEWFFISPDLPELHVKQAHMMKNNVQKHLRPDDGWFNLKFAEANDLNSYLNAHWCGRDDEIYRGLTYLQRMFLNQNKYDLPKILSGERTRYSSDGRFTAFLNGMLAVQTDETIMNYLRKFNMIDLDQSINDYHGMFSKFYYLGDHK